MKHVISMLSALVLMTNFAMAEDSSAKHSHQAQSKNEALALKLNYGQKWKTDLPLRQGMEKIEKAMNDNLADIHGGKADVNTYNQLAAVVDSQIQFLFKNCKLTPEADTQLHLIISKMMTASSLMKTGPKLEERQKGAIEVMRALTEYENYFDHAG